MNTTTNHSAELTELIKTHIERLATETDETQRSREFLAYLAQMSKFHSYSIGNIFLIMAQCPTATRVAGARTWNKLGRYVKRGEHGIAILAPMPVPDAQDATRTRVFFKTVHVFDITQTDGEPLCELDTTPTERSAWVHARLVEWLGTQGYSIQVAEDLNGAAGRIHFKLKVVHLLPSSGTAVLIHECAHLILHANANEAPASTSEREVEAEATAYVVGQHFGVETKSPAYLATWSTPEVIRASLSRVQRAANTLIHVLEITTQLSKKEEVANAELV